MEPFLKTSVSKRRKGMIQILYRFFITNNVSRIKQDILDDIQLVDYDDDAKKIIFDCIDWAEYAIDIIEPNLSLDWRWYRLPKIIQSILVSSVYEIVILKTKKAIIINEAIEYTRNYLPNWDTNFVNAILDKVDEEV